VSTLKERAMKTTATAVKINTALQDSLLATVDALSRRRACDIPEETIARFVAMRWLQWNGGNLRLTAAGEDMLAKVHAAMLDNLQAA
jgi:archaellum component FlaD/FlaE